jgi:dihydroorotase
MLRGFLGQWGRDFYGIERSQKKILLKKGKEAIPESLKAAGVEVVLFRKGEATWTVEWQ